MARRRLRYDRVPDGNASPLEKMRTVLQPSSGSVSVLIGHDQAEARAELRRVVASQGDMRVIGETDDGEELVARALRERPDVVVIELTLPGCGLRGLQRLAENDPPIRVVIVAMDDSNVTLLRSALAHGSLGYVVTGDHPAELVSVIRKMTAGRSYLEVPTGGLAAPGGMPADLAQRLDRLSKREREVLEAVAYGYTNREVAEWLGVSVKSVETYRYRLADKLDFNSRADLVRFALGAGLLDPTSDPLARVQP